MLLDRILIPGWPLCTSATLQAAVGVTACSDFVVWKVRNEKISLNYRFIPSLSFSHSWGVRKVYYVLEKNGILFFSTSVVTPIKSLPKSHWSKLASVKGSWPCGHLKHGILKIRSMQRNKGSLHTVDNSACKVPICHLTDSFYMQLFESFGLEWKWNSFQEPFPDHFGLFPKMWVVVKLLSFVSEQTVSAGFGCIWTVQSMEHFRFALGTAR